jgi:hypothetical protein
VYAALFMIRDKCDWVYNKQKDNWEQFPLPNDKPDIKAAPEQVVQIISYRVEVRMKFAGRGGPPKQAVLTMVTPSGDSIRIPQRKGAALDGPGFLLLGPDAEGMYEVSFSPSYKEVGRGGKTRAELVVEHANGRTERVVQELDTP